MGKYAKNTDVSPDKTLMEIQATLKRYQASKFGFIDEGDKIGVAFEMSGRRVRFVLPLPKPGDPVTRNKGGGPQGNRGAYNANLYEQAVRQCWRALLLCIKAKLESVEARIETFDEAFMAQLILPSGETMAQWAIPQLAKAFESGKMPPLLLESGS